MQIEIRLQRVRCMAPIHACTAQFANLQVARTISTRGQKHLKILHFFQKPVFKLAHAMQIEIRLQRVRRMAPMHACAAQFSSLQVARTISTRGQKNLKILLNFRNFRRNLQNCIKKDR